MLDRGGAEQVAVFGSTSSTDAAAAVFVSGVSGGAAVAVSGEVNQVASCGWPFANARPRCFPPFVRRENHSLCPTVRSRLTVQGRLPTST
jgi:hypothetical protein